ncbi:DNA-directed RNA polymerase subunit beta [Streptococcus oricebi]|uniref:DNA-directed RNA polymerase subunit beta n=1 Tax=Streptococcus oricebi TaxID=1547447 RepID=A0ABS5B1A9_9STRE|nr:DNA-directed RNA polymerase subunit beta [Streptococcus oricebi]MBP2622597.1 DNA-directed RNA polymerase subunit beta [Streptococcus oricebi]
MNRGWKYVGKQVGIVALVLFLGLLALALGLVIGYGTVGGNENPWSILSPDTWQRLLAKFTGS